MSEINAVANLEIHCVDSSGVISWNFMGDTPDFPFVDWNFSNTTEEDYQWLVDCIHREDKDIYVADFSEQGAYSCRILVQRFFGLETLGPDMEGSPMHQTLLAAYDKLFA